MVNQIPYILATTVCMVAVVMYGWVFHHPEQILSEKEIANNYPAVGEYWRPPLDQTSGDYQSTKPYFRSPCPALNVLANHGYLNRNGKDLSVNVVAEAAHKVFHLPLGKLYFIAFAAKIRNSFLPFAPFNLALIGKHGGLEHDASLFHYDHYTKKESFLVSTEFVEELIKLSKDGKTITLDEVIAFRNLRTQHSIDNNPEFSLDSFAQTVAGIECAIFLNVLGKDNSILISHFRSFVIDEKFPKDWTFNENVNITGLGDRIMAQDIALQDHVIRQKVSPYAKSS